MAYKKEHYQEEHPIDIHGGRFNYDGKHIPEDKYSERQIPKEDFESKRHEQRRLEELGIKLDDYFDLSQTQSSKTAETDAIP